MKKNVSYIVGGVLLMALTIGLTVYGVYYNNLAKQQRLEMENHYAHAFSDMMEYTTDAEEFLLKALATGTPEKTVMMLNEAWRCTSQAQSALSLLPIDQQLMSSVSNYLVQLGDVAYTWSTQIINSKMLTDDQYNTLNKLYGYAQDLNGGLQTLSTQLLMHELTWEDIEQSSTSTQQEDDQLSEKYVSITSLSKPFNEYPTLVYDGPFSAHMSNIEPRGLSGRKITHREGYEKVSQFFEEHTDYTPNVTFNSENSNRNIVTYSYTVTFDEQEAYVAYIDITKQGGDLYSLLFYRETGDVVLSSQEAIEAGRKFLSDIGMEQMEPSYYTIEGCYLTANYSYSDDEILYYPDMVKVKIALDTGEVTGFEGHGYLAYHTRRDYPEAAYTKEEAQEQLSPRLTVVSSQEAVIPNNYGGEEHVYEFRCTGFGREFLIYVDTETLRETEIFILIEDGNGKLTV